MNLPTGVAKVLGRNVKLFDAKRELEDLASSDFSGYVIESVLGEQGLEESALLFRSGQGVGAVYEYYGLRTALQGDEALPHVMNAFASSRATLDVMGLSLQQSDLITAFNAKLKLSKPLARGQFRSLVRDSFDATLAQKVTKEAHPEQAQTKESLFKKFGLMGIDGQ